MTEIVFFRYAFPSVSSQCKNIPDTVVFKLLQEVINFASAVAQTGKMHKRFDTVLVLYSSCEFNCPVVICTSAGAECDTDKIRFEFCQNIKRAGYIRKRSIMFRRINFEGKIRSPVFELFCNFHTGRVPEL